MAKLNPIKIKIERRNKDIPSPLTVALVIAVALIAVSVLVNLAELDVKSGSLRDVIVAAGREVRFIIQEILR